MISGSGRLRSPRIYLELIHASMMYFLNDYCMPSWGDCRRGQETNKQGNNTSGGEFFQENKTEWWDGAPAGVCLQKVALAGTPTIRSCLMKSTVLVEKLYGFGSKSIIVQHAGRSQCR